MSEHKEVIADIWRKIQGDPELLSGLTTGEFDDFVLAVFDYTMANEPLKRAITVGLVIRISRWQAELSNYEESVSIVKEWVNTPAIREEFDNLAGN